MLLLLKFQGTFVAKYKIRNRKKGGKEKERERNCGEEKVTDEASFLPSLLLLRECIESEIFFRCRVCACAREKERKLKMEAKALRPLFKGKTGFGKEGRKLKGKKEQKIEIIQQQRKVPEKKVET